MVVKNNKPQLGKFLKKTYPNMNCQLSYLARAQMYFKSVDKILPHLPLGYFHIFS